MEFEQQRFKALEEKHIALKRDYDAVLVERNALKSENAILHSSINVLTEQLSIAERMASESLHGKTQMPVEIHDDSVSYDKKTLRRKETDLLLLQKLRQSQPEESELARVTLEKQDLEAKVEKLAAVLDRQLAVDVAAAVLPPPASPMVAPHRADSGRSPASPRSPRAHSIHSSIKVHAVVSGELDFDHATALLIPLGETSDEQLLAEVAIRQLDLHDKITDSLVKQTYSIGKVLGRGASGQVYEATHKKTGVKYACKVVKKDANMNDAQSMSTEIEIMKRIRHRNVCSMYELYESPQKLWIILELVNGGDLHRFVANSSQFNEVIASRYFKQILKGVHYLHSLGVVHRDLKLDNILLAGSGSGAVVKVADFGLAALVRLDEMGYDIEESAKRKGYRELREMWGTKAFFAPEVVEQNYGPQADVWSLGCVLFEMLSGEQAFTVQAHDTEDDFFERIRKGQCDFGKLKGVSEEAKSLIQGMLIVDPEARLSASECLMHPWITGQAHKEQHTVPLTSAQQSMKSRIEKKK